MNVKRMEKLAKFIEALPKEKFDMGTWFSSDLETPVVCMTDAMSDCGTACCIAGWTVFMAGKCFDNASSFVRHGKSKRPLGKPGNRVYTKTFASSYLDLREGEANTLFYTVNWPDEFRNDQDPHQQ